MSDDEITGLRYANERLREQRDTALALAEQRAEALKGVEWGGSTTRNGINVLACCPACRAIRGIDLHAPLCWLAAALRDTPEPKAELAVAALPPRPHSSDALALNAA